MPEPRREHGDAEESFGGGHAIGPTHDDDPALCHILDCFAASDPAFDGYCSERHRELDARIRRLTHPPDSRQQAVEPEWKLVPERIDPDAILIPARAFNLMQNAYAHLLDGQIAKAKRLHDAAVEARRG